MHPMETSTYGRVKKKIRKYELKRERRKKMCKEVKKSKTKKKKEKKAQVSQAHLRLMQPLPLRA